ELSGATFAVSVQDVGGATTGASTSGFGVADAPLTAGALTPPAAIEGAALTNVVLSHFSDANPGGTAGDFSATITWGDGATSSWAVVANPPGASDVLGSHPYAAELSGATFAVSVQDAGGATTGASTSGFRVADAPLTAGVLTPPAAVEGAPLTNVVLFHF